MKNSEKIKKLGAKGIISINGLNIQVYVIDFKFSFGRHRWLVKPVTGSNEVWVENIEFLDEYEDEIKIDKNEI